MPHELWTGPLPVCLAECHEGRVRRLRLVLTAKSFLLDAETTYLPDGPHFPGNSVKMASSLGVPWMLAHTLNGSLCRIVGNRESGDFTIARTQGVGAA